jgi:hypothetical protein
VEEKREKNVLPSYEEYVAYMRSIHMEPMDEHFFKVYTHAGFNLITKKWIQDLDKP